MALSGLPTALSCVISPAPPTIRSEVPRVALHRLPLFSTRMMEAKRQRIRSLAGLGGVTDQALQRIVQKIREDPTLLDDVISRSTISAASLALMAEIGQTDTLETNTGDFTWHHGDPRLLLQHFVSVCEPFAKTLQNKLRETPSTFMQPWNVVLYCDEITPGNVLRPDNARKVHAFYFSFRELGKEVLCHAEAWLPVALLRANAVKTIVGKLSCAMRMLLRRFFVGPMALQTAGVTLELPDGPSLFFCRLGNILGDESALKSLWSSKGAAGLLPCILCKNICTRFLHEHDASGYLQELSCAEVEQLDLSSSADIWQKVDTLAARHAISTRAEFDQLEKAYGITHCPTGLLSDQALREIVGPAEVHTYDSMHCAFANGLAHFEMYEFLRKSKLVGVSYATLQTYLHADWQWPADKRQKGRSLHQLFNPVREASNSEHFRASASEILMLCPVMRHFVLQILRPTGQLIAEIASFLAMTVVLDRLQEFKKGKGDAVAFGSAIRDHLEKFKLAYGSEACKPKHHFMLHLPAHLARDLMPLDCFVLERKHQMVKACCNWIDNTSAFEKSALVRAVQEQTRQLQEPGWAQDGLKGRCVPSMELAAAQQCRQAHVAPRAASGGVAISAGDVVVLRNELLLVESCASLDGTLCLVVRNLTRVRALTAHAWRCKLEPAFALVDCAASSLQQVSCWTREGQRDFVIVT
jgi:hypothetical protein